VLQSNLFYLGGQEGPEKGGKLARLSHIESVAGPGLAARSLDFIGILKPVSSNYLLKYGIENRHRK
jgi:hypothetical protein